MPDDAIGYAFNDKAATMSITVLNLTEASALLRTINKRDIKDVRAIDLDLALCWRAATRSSSAAVPWRR